MPVKVLISDYDPNWPRRFERERDAVLASCGDHIEQIEHIGSTSVPGLAAKPVIDILIGVSSLAVADAHCITPIVSLGYEYLQRAEGSMPFRRYFRKDDSDGARTHQIHLVEGGSDFWNDHLLFRDHLREDAADREAYERVKRALAKQEWEKTNDYAIAKGDFISAVLEKAKAQRDS